MTDVSLMLTEADLEHSFEPNSLLLSSRRGALEAQLEQLKERLLEPMVKSVESAELAQELRWVANEAAALAWFTVCPILVLPTLLEEKVRSALQWWEQQENIRHRQAGGKETGQPNSTRWDMREQAA